MNLLRPCHNHKRLEVPKVCLLLLLKQAKEISTMTQPWQVLSQINMGLPKKLLSMMLFSLPWGPDLHTLCPALPNGTDPFKSHHTLHQLAKKVPPSYLQIQWSLISLPNQCQSSSLRFRETTEGCLMIGHLFGKNLLAAGTQHHFICNTILDCSITLILFALQLQQLREVFLVRQLGSNPGQMWNYAKLENHLG